jgi:G:T-mismatch repair DNA endonuclease (very short patch repair protein)
MLKERNEGIKILHGRNGKERGLPELPGIRVDGLWYVTRTVYKISGCYWHGHT